MKQEAERTLRYMRSTAGWGLLYHGGEGALKLTMYVDTSYSKGEHCCSGWVAVLGGAAISWKAKRQKARSDSSCAAEFRAAKAAAKEVIWLRYLLEYMLCKQDAVTLACDSKSAVHLMKGMAVRTKSKDLCRDLPMLRDWVATGEIDPKHIAGDEQPADFLTKALATPSFARCKERVGMRSSMMGTTC